ncbi:unnamed protein product [Sympodiomycopsis kandeliae]
MCGRFPNALTPQQYRRAARRHLSHHHHNDDQDGDDDNEASSHPRTTPGWDNYKVGYNISPTCYAPVILQDTQGAVIQSMKWGLLPSYLKPGSDSNPFTLKTINARSDSILNKSPMWYKPFSSGQRCVLFLQGFYEWKKLSNERIPYYISLESEKMMPVACLWSKNTHLDSKDLYTFTIITTDVSNQLQWLHDRQPLILSSLESIETWLNPDSKLENVIQQCIKVFEGSLKWYAVPKEVGKVGNDDESFVQPVKERKDGLMAAFKRVNVDKSKGDPENNAPNGKVERDVNQETHDSLTRGNAVKQETDDDASLDNKRVKKEDTSDQIKSKGEIDTDNQVDQISHTTASKQQDTTPSLVGGSSRFSPNPFDPPLSPYRPNGGYSIESDPHGGLTKYSRPTSTTPGDKRKREEPIRGQGALEVQFKRQKVISDVQAAQKEVEQSKQGEQQPGSPRSKSGTAANRQSPAGSPPRSKSKATANRDSPAGSPPRSKSNTTTANRQRKSSSSGDTTGQKDIRNFFKSP